jgi:hypothetical protein
MPQPPKNVSEALLRCPNDEDTLARRWRNDLRLLEQYEQSSIEKDSIKFGNAKRLPQVSVKEMNEYRSLQLEVDAQRDSLVARLRRVTSASSENLLTAIRTIGEELDNDIKNCPKVGAQQIHDSVCVEKAESFATTKRIQACDSFLATASREWSVLLEPLQKSLLSREVRIAQLLATTKHHRLALQLKRLRLESWQTLAPILKTIDEVTRLAAQFIL